MKVLKPRNKKLIDENWEAATAAFLLLKGHTLEYFFNMSYLDKLFAYTAMRKQQEIEAQKIEFEAQLAGVKLVRRQLNG